MKNALKAIQNLINSKALVIQHRYAAQLLLETLIIVLKKYEPDKATESMILEWKQKEDADTLALGVEQHVRELIAVVHALLRPMELTGFIKALEAGV